MKLDIVEINPKDAEFLKFSEQNDEVFNSPKWLLLFGNKLKLYAIKQDNLIIGIFHLYHTRLKNIACLANPPFTPNIGLKIHSRSSNTTKKNKFHKDITKLVSEFIDSQKPKIKILSLPIPIIDTQAFQWNNFKVIPRYTYQIDLAFSLEEILKNMDSKTRSLIQKENDLKVVGFKNKAEIKEVILNTLVDNKASQDVDILNKIFDEYAEENNALILGIEDQGKINAGAVFVFDSKVMYYILGGGDKKLKNASAGSLLIWEAIKSAKEMGLQTFDFEGSMVPEIERFFRGFGGEIIPYYSINKASTLFEIPLKRKFKHIF